MEPVKLVSTLKVIDWWSGNFFKNQTQGGEVF